MQADRCLGVFRHLVHRSSASLARSLNPRPLFQKRKTYYWFMRCNAAVHYYLFSYIHLSACVKWRNMNSRLKAAWPFKVCVWVVREIIFFVLFLCKFLNPFLKCFDYIQRRNLTSVFYEVVFFYIKKQCFQLSCINLYWFMLLRFS